MFNFSQIYLQFYVVDTIDTYLSSQIITHLFNYNSQIYKHSDSLFHMVYKFGCMCLFL